MSLNFDALFRQMVDAPQVRDAVKDKADDLAECMEIRWPAVNDLPARDRAFLDGDQSRVIQVTEATRGTNRPVHVVTVRHPGAVAAQAKNSFVTKAVRDVS